MQRGADGKGETLPSAKRSRGLRAPAASNERAKPCKVCPFIVWRFYNGNRSTKKNEKFMFYVLVLKGL